MTTSDDMIPRDDDDERLVPGDEDDDERPAGMTDADEEWLGQVADYLCGEMRNPELDNFLLRLESDDKLSAEVAMFEQLWAKPRATRGAVLDDPVTSAAPKQRSRNEWTLRLNVTDKLEGLLASAAALPPRPVDDGENEAWQDFYEDFQALNEFILTRLHGDKTQPDPEEEAALRARADIDEVRRRIEDRNSRTARVFRNGSPAVILDISVTNLEQAVADYRDRVTRIGEYWEHRLYGDPRA